MTATLGRVIVASALSCAMSFGPTAAQAADPLPSWNEGKTKQSIVDFVAKVTKQGSPEFVSRRRTDRHVRQRRHALGEQPAVRPFRRRCSHLRRTARLLSLRSSHRRRARVGLRCVAPRQARKGLEEASAKGWTVVDMKNDWKVIYPFEKK